MTVSILDALAMLPTGDRGVPLRLDEFGAYLRGGDGANLLSDDEKRRNARHARRDRLYQDGGHADMRAFLHEMFIPSIAEKLGRRVEVANFSNALKRVVGELSTVYARPARRTLSDPAQQAKLDAVVDALDLDAQLAFANAMLNLHRALLVGPRVRKNADGSRTLVLDIATPSTVRAVANPLDTTQIVAWLISVDMPLARNPYDRKPAWVMWTDHEWCYLDENLEPIGASWTPHGLGVNRWVPLSYSANAIPRFWPGCEGEDLVAARMSEWLCDALMIKEAQSTTRIPVTSGDMSTAARGQSGDSEAPVHLPEGATITTVEIGTDPKAFIDVGDHALERVGNGYGLPMSVLTHQGAQSAEARVLLLAPVKERREKQIHIMRRFEARLIAVIARVCAVDLPALAFDPSGFRVDFSETQELLSRRDRLDVFEVERRLGVSNTIDFLMAENPDLDEPAAWEVLRRNIVIETARNLLMRPLQAIAGSLGAESPSPDVGRQQPPNDGPRTAEPPMEAAAAA